jgi:hypothetical protein
MAGLVEKITAEAAARRKETGSQPLGPEAILAIAVSAGRSGSNLSRNRSASAAERLFGEIRRNR